MKKTIYFILSLFLVIMWSCDDYLEETDYHNNNVMTSFEDEESFEYLVNGCYITLRSWYGKENGWDYTESGTDLYTFGADNRSQAFCDYRNWLTGESFSRNRVMWRELYIGLNTCNTVLKYMDDVPFSNAGVKEQRRAEVLFLRAHYLWIIVETWGGVHFQTEPQESVTHTANRTSVDKFYEQIFADLEAAENIFLDPANGAVIPSGADYGRVYLGTVQAMMARMYLTRKDYANAELYASKVIDNSNFGLLNEWAMGIWNMNNMHNSEVIWSVNYSDDRNFANARIRDVNGTIYDQNDMIQREGGNQGLVMWQIRVDNSGWGVGRNYPTLERGFLRWMPTRYFIDMFDETIDKRFYENFKMAWIADDIAPCPTWPATVYIGSTATPVDSAKIGKRMVEPFDTNFIFSKQPYTRPRATLGANGPLKFDLEKGYIVFDINDIYLPDGKPTLANSRSYYFPMWHRYQDTTRTEFMNAGSGRNVFVFRISEMYLIRAEALYKQERYSEAYNDLLALANARAYGVNNGAALLQAYGINSGTDITDDYILDERARELATEALRFFDLKRFGEEKFLARIKAGNPDAAPYVQGYHMIRPIPQAQLDAVYNKDEFVQNPGYN
ncbi:MAG: RagB/SusD family nutrient uptake outer membrane protein [Bacteroidales bacterium]|nr:RagB/SusD family nutrient uptake outer membrane protein [Bacteroidales bacterium]